MGKFVLDMDMVDSGKRSAIAKCLDYDEIRITVAVEVKDSQDPLTLQQMADEGGEVLKAKRKAITQELLELCDWITVVSRNESAFNSEWPKRKQDVLKCVEGHVAEGEAKAKKAMEKALEIAKKDKREALKIKVTFASKSVVKGLQVAGSIGKIVATGGLNVVAWLRLIKNIAALATTVYQYCSSLEKKWEHLREAIETLSNTRSELKRAREALESESDNTAKEKLKAAYEIAKTVFKDPQKKALEKCKIFRDEVTLVQTNAHDLAGKLNELLKKDQTGLDEKQVVALEQQVDKLITSVIDLEQKASAGKQLAEAAGKHFVQVKEELQDLQMLTKGMEKVMQALKIAKKIADGAEKLLAIIG